jgi:hypothetical protein
LEFLWLVSPQPGEGGSNLSSIVPTFHILQLPIVAIGLRCQPIKMANGNPRNQPNEPKSDLAAQLWAMADMDDLVPVLNQRALGRDISGLSAYEQK